MLLLCLFVERGSFVVSPILHVIFSSSPVGNPVYVSLVNDFVNVTIDTQSGIQSITDLTASPPRELDVTHDLYTFTADPVATQKVVLVFCDTLMWSPPLTQMATRCCFSMWRCCFSMWIVYVFRQGPGGAYTFSPVGNATKVVNGGPEGVALASTVAQVKWLA